MKTIPASFSALDQLVSDYEEQRLSRDEYRARRKAILDLLERQYNGRPGMAGEPSQSGSILGRLTGFIKGLSQ